MADRAGAGFGQSEVSAIVVCGVLGSLLIAVGFLAVNDEGFQFITVGLGGALLFGGAGLGVVAAWIDQRERKAHEAYMRRS